MISFRLFAGTDVGLRDNNEDNFTVCPDLMQDEWIIPADHQQEIPLGERGSILVVADGMGGQNAGEVASAIAIATVQKMFSSKVLPDGVWTQASTVREYLKKVVRTADAEVKAYSARHPEAEGLGSTIVIAWILSGTVYVCWLGDSRAYAFVPGKGIGRLSKDHSYVQQLVDAGTMTDEEAMVHPNSNIITRSLGDTTQKARPEVAEYPLETGEILLLCSDGLCGVCRDEDIGGIIEANEGNLKDCKDRLTEAALANGGSDNITIVLLQVCDGVEANPDGPTGLFPRRGLKFWGGIAAFGALLLMLVLLLFPRKPAESSAPDVHFTVRSAELSADRGLQLRVGSHSNAQYDFLCDDSRIRIRNVDNGAIIGLDKDASFKNDAVSSLVVVSKADSTKSDTLRLVLKKKKVTRVLFDLSGVKLRPSGETANQEVQVPPLFGVDSDKENEGEVTPSGGTNPGKATK